MADRVLCAFDPTTDFFALVTADSRLNVYDTATGNLRQQFVHKEHLALRYTCLAWSLPAAKAGARAKRSKGSSALGRIALGTEGGVVIVWDLKRAHVAHELGKGGSGHTTRVNGVAFTPAGTLISCGDDRHVLEWNAQDGTVARTLSASKHGAKAVAVSPDGSHVAAASALIKLWDMSSGKRIAKLSGHAAEVEHLCFSPDGRYVLAASADRFITLWRADAAGTHRSALRTFVVDSRPVALHVGAGLRGAQRSLAVAVTSQAGRVSVWDVDESGLDAADKRAAKGKHSGDAASASPAPPSCVVSVEAAGSATAGGAFAACVGALAVQGALIVARGSVAKPTFDMLTTAESGERQSQVALTAGPGTALLLGASGSARQDGARKEGIVHPERVHVVGAGEQPLPQSMDAAEPGAARGVKRAAGEALLGDAAPADGDAESEGAEDAEEDLTLEERLRAMMQGVDADVRAAATEADPEEAAAAAAAAAIVQTRGPPKASSLHTVLEQALKTNDNAMLEYCLNVSDKQMVDATVQRLPPALVLPFLTRIMAKFERRPARGEHLCTWIRALLVQHTAYLMSVPDLVQHLAGLYQTIDTRLTVFKKLLRLSGRLDLALSQVALRQRHGGQAEDAPATRRTVYESSMRLESQGAGARSAKRSKRKAAAAAVAAMSEDEEEQGSAAAASDDEEEAEEGGQDASDASDASAAESDDEEEEGAEDDDNNDSDDNDDNDDQEDSDDDGASDGESAGEDEGGANDSEDEDEDEASEEE